MNTKPSSRRYDLDWLKALAVLLVPFAHAAIIFTNTTYHIKNSETSLAMDIVVATIALPIMPLFFTISGMSIQFALRSKSTRQFLRSRFIRLMIPFLFGVLTISSVSTYYALRYRRILSGSFFEFYPHYFDGFWGYGGYFPWFGHHLYFLLYLFVYSVVGLPLFLYLRREENQRWIRALAAIASKPFGLYVMVLPVILIQFINPLQGLLIPHQGGWHFFSYAVFLLCGFLFASNDAFQDALHSHARYAPAVAGVMLAMGLALYSVNQDPFLVMVLAGFYAFSVNITILCAAQKRLSKPSRALALLTDSALPVYIVHEGILVTAAFYITPMDLGILPKLGLILALTLPLIALATWGIRRVNVLRFLFGLPRLPRD